MKTAFVSLTSALALALGCMSAAAQVSVHQPFRHAIGMGAGFTTGYGLSYRYFPGKLGYQLTFAPYGTENTSRYSAGFTFLYPLILAESTTLYLYQGNHFYYSSDRIFYLEADKTTEAYEPTEFTGRRTDRFTNHGVGFGIEMNFAKRMGFNLMAGYATYDSFNKVNVTAETGLYFKY